MIRKLYDDFAVILTDKSDKKTRFGCPLSFNRLTPTWFLNHSSRPNVRCDDNYHFVALRDIVPGNELTVDYSKYSEKPPSPKRRR
jgi:SET domain-containing protein